MKLNSDHFYYLRWILGPLAATIIWLLPFDLDPAQHRLAGLVIWVVLWWIAEPIPLAATALLGATGLVVLGITSAKVAYSGFAHPLVFLFFGGFLIARAMAVHGLDKRIALYILTRPMIAGRPVRILFALLGVAFFMSMWISNTATTAMLLPIGTGILANILPNQPKAQGVGLLAMAYAASIGGTATPVGSTPNIVAMGMMEKIMGHQMSFIQWMALGFPVALCCFVFLCWITKKRMPELPEKFESSYLHDEYNKLGFLKLAEKNTLRAAAIAVTLWVGPALIAILIKLVAYVVTSLVNPGIITETTAEILVALQHWITWMKGHFPEAVVAMLAASMLFILRIEDRKPTLKWKDAVQIDWSSLLLFGGGISLGTQLFDSGLAKILGSGLLNLIGPDQFWLFIIIAVFFAIFFTELVSNTATANMLLPLILSLSLVAHYNPLIPTLGVALACSYAFMMMSPDSLAWTFSCVQLSQ